MSTLEATVSMLEALPEDDLAAINGIVKQFYIKLGTANLSPLSEDEMIEALKTAQKHAEEGELTDGHELADKMRNKYAI